MSALRPHFPLNPVQQNTGDFSFGQSREGVDGSIFVDEGDLVGIGLKADTGGADVVGDNQVELLLL